jgi:pseudouridine-5'-phosphate glycosidase
MSVEVRPAVAEALASRRPIVALESTVISHGLPRPRNLEMAMAMEETVAAGGALPATVGIIDGAVVVGLERRDLERLAAADGVRKVSRRNLAWALAAGGLGATTVATTAWAADTAGVGIMATGGIGGVHRGAESSFDVSADLDELAVTPVAVVCSGAKAILDLPKTLEALETRGVPVIGYGTSVFPAFYSADSGLILDQRVDDPAEAAAVMGRQRELGLRSGIVFANPPPATAALESADVEQAVAAAVASAESNGITGAEVTPYLLDHLARHSDGRTVEVNVALLLSNAAVAAAIAVAAVTA